MGTQQGRPNPGVRPQQGGPRPQGRPAPMGVQQGRPNPGMRPQPMPQGANGTVLFNTNGAPLLRPNEESRAQQVSVQPRPQGKFINDTQEEYTFQKKEVAHVQQPTNPALRANPMAIFGANNNALRPTSADSLRNGGRGNVCPQCGFAVKPGQPMCVVCGRRLR
jgi:hypothetical protein